MNVPPPPPIQRPPQYQPRQAKQPAWVIGGIVFVAFVLVALISSTFSGREAPPAETPVAQAMPIKADDTPEQVAAKQSQMKSHMTSTMSAKFAQRYPGSTVTFTGDVESTADYNTTDGDYHRYTIHGTIVRDPSQDQTPMRWTCDFKISGAQHQTVDYAWFLDDDTKGDYGMFDEPKPAYWIK